MARRKLPKGVTQRAIAPAHQRLARVLKTKKLPRGRPFPKGHQVGLATRFKKGAPSPNPAGRPSLKKLTEASRAQQAEIVPLKELLAAKLPAELYGRTYAECHAWKLGNAGLHGNIAAIAELGDRAEGRPGTVNSGDDSSNPLHILIASMQQHHRENYGTPEGHVPLRENMDEENDEIQPAAANSETH